MKRGWVLFVLLCVIVVMSIDKKHTETYVVYGNMKCPFTVKMLDEIKSNNHSVTFVDVSTTDGHKQFAKVTTQTNGVPYTVNTTTGEHIVGYRKV